MPSVDLKMPGVTLDQLNNALARTQSKQVRLRLKALIAILDGKSVPEAARVLKTAEANVARWLTTVQQSGLPSLLNFLTRDPRMVERKKYGRRGARRRFQFSKR